MKTITTTDTGAFDRYLGENIFVRTVTLYYTGKLTAIDTETGALVLEDAAWIADAGRFSDALATGTLSEVEPFPDEVVVMLGAVVDISPWGHPLPRDQK